MMPLTKPQTGSPSVRDDQLMMPIRARSCASNTGPPESPLQTPRPALSPSVRGSTRLNCCELGRSVATRTAARRRPAVLRSPCTATPKPATINRSPTDGGTRRSLNAAGVRPGAGGAASLTSARSGASERGENWGCGATLATSFTAGRRPSKASRRYLPFASTQCAAVSTRSGAIATPVQRLFPPTINTTWRAIDCSAGWAPPTMAATVVTESARQARAAAALIDRGPITKMNMWTWFRDAVTSSAISVFGRMGVSVRGSLPRGRPRIPFLLLEEGLLDFIVDAQQPCLGAGRAIAEVRGLGLGLARSLFGGAKLERKFMSEIHGSRTIVLRHLRGLLQQGDDRTAGGVRYD